VLLFGYLACSKEAPLPKTPQQPPERFITKQRPMMGTTFQILAFIRTKEQEHALDDALLLIADLETRWSPWIENSEVHKINQEAGKKPVKVSADTLALLQRSVAMCFETQKAFDPTFFALNSLYDFKKEPFEPPSEEDLAEALKLVGCEHIKINANDSTVHLTKPGMRIHLGGNAKGTSLDEAAKVLSESGIKRFVVDGGGDIVSLGDGPKGPWRVGVQHPREARGSLMGLIANPGGSVATSGDYERFATIKGTRYHHIIDTRTGKPSKGCMSATVVVPTTPRAGELADSIATALCVLGHKDGFEFLSKYPGIEAALLSPDGTIHKTEGFTHRIEFSAAPKGTTPSTESSE